MNPSPVGTPTAPNPSQRRATSPAAGSLDVWIRLPNLNHELPEAEAAVSAVMETAPAEPARQAVARTESQSENVVALGRRTMHTPQLMPEGRSISPVALLTGIVAATALFCLLLVGGRKSSTEKSSAEKPAVEKPAATGSASASVETKQANAKSIDGKADDKNKNDAAKTAEVKEKKKKKKKPNMPPSDAAPNAEEPVIGVTPWPRKDPVANSANHEAALGGTAPINNASGEFVEQSTTPYPPPTTTPWPPQREAQLPPEYRNPSRAAEFEGTIQKPEYRAEHDRIRSSLH